jgi:hydroxymethylpyrimidine pyrophosphatase-like HAD family hydrolase
MENPLCFGDDYNDLNMFEVCETSVAMGNGIKELKDIATYITQDNDRDGVALFLQKYSDKSLPMS